MPAEALFGINVDPVCSQPRLPFRLAELADRSGLELVAMQDHPYQAGHFETWTLLSALATRTERVRFVGDVLNLPLRPPAMLAKSLASLDVLSAGRVEMGLGAGGVPEAISALGGPRRRPGQARAALSEAIDICRLMWGEQRALHYEGEYYRLAGVHPGPPPAHEVEVWVGGTGHRMLELIGAKADGWIASSMYVSPERVAEGNAVIDHAARTAGRDPRLVRRVYNVMGVVGGQHADEFHGPVDVWVDTIQRLHGELPVDAFVFWPEREHEHQCELFANEVVPAARDALSS